MAAIFSLYIFIVIIYIYGIISIIISFSPFSKFLSAFVSSPFCLWNYLNFSLSLHLLFLYWFSMINSFFFISSYHKYFYHAASFYSKLWWLILCASLMGLRDTQQAGKTLFLGVSIGCFSKEISIWIAEWNKVNRHPLCEWPVSSRTQIEQRGRGRVHLLSLLELSPPSPALGHQYPPVLKPLDWDMYHWLFWFSGLWTRLNDTTNFPDSPVCRQ